MNTVNSNRDRLLHAATELFLEHGYDASVDAITCRAGVARQTFYNHFRSKECLFAEVIRDSVIAILAPLNTPIANLRDSLKNFASVYRQQALSPNGIAAYRILTSQAQQFPDLIREVFGMGDGQMIVRLAGFLQHAMEQGRLCRTDSLFAAEMLMAMLMGQERTHLLLGVQRPPLDEVLQVERVIDGFLRMFAPND